MLQGLTKRHAPFAELMITVALLAFVWMYFPSAAVGLKVVRNHGSLEPFSLSTGDSKLTEPQALKAAPGADVSPGHQGHAFTEATDRRHHPSGHHKSGPSALNNHDRRQALAALGALLIQIQSAGPGG